MRVVLSCKAVGPETVREFPVSSHDYRLAGLLDNTSHIWRQLPITSLAFYMAPVICEMDKKLAEGLCWCECWYDCSDTE